VSTGGEAPALAGLVREGLEALVPDDVERWVATAGTLRQRQRELGVPMSLRRPLLLHALNLLYASRAQGDGDITTPSSSETAGMAADHRPVSAQTPVRPGAKP
jgi:siroheme synthase (precorrin-2 oxidase/ferrochelatase)